MFALRLGNGRPARVALMRAVCAAIVWAFAEAAAAGACNIGIVGELLVDSANNRLRTSGLINGHEVEILIDTGSTFSFIWSDAARQLNLTASGSNAKIDGVGGQVEVSETVLNHLQIGRFHGDHLLVGIISRTDNAGRRRNSDFVLGEDFFSRYDTEFDLAHGKIRLLRTKACAPEQTPYWAQKFSMLDLEGFDYSQPRIKATVRLNGKAVSAIFDTGAQRSIITRHGAQRAGIAPWEQGVKPIGTTGGLGRVREDTWIGTLDSFTIGDETVSNVRLRIGDLFEADRETTRGSRIPREINDQPGMLIGCDFFQAHRVLILAKAHRMVFTYGGGPIFQIMQPAEKPKENVGPEPGTDNVGAH